MRVLYAPYFGENEYQDLLMESVSKEGVTTVTGRTSGLFSLTRQCRSKGSIDVVHLIWTNKFFIVASDEESTAKNLVRKSAAGVRAIAFILDILLLKLLGIGILWTVHNKHNHGRHHVRLDHTVSIVLSSLVDQMTVECPAAKEIIVELFRVSDPSKIHVVPEGNYIGAYPDDVDQETARERLGIDSETFLFVFFGQIRPYKDVPGLIDAFEGLDLPEARLMVVGKPASNEMATDLRRQVEGADDVVPVFEFVPNDEIQYYMNAADIVVLPYRDIMTSGSVLLAMSFGQAVIAPNIGCIPALLDEEGGFLYRPDEPNGLGAALSEAYDSDVVEMGRENYRRAEALSWDDVGRRTVEFYRRTLAK